MNQLRLQVLAACLFATLLYGGEHLDKANAIATADPKNLAGEIAELKLELLDYPNNKTALMHLAASYTVAGKYQESIQTLETLEKIYTVEKATNLLVYWLMVQDYFFKGDNAKCLELLDKYRPVFARNDKYRKMSERLEEAIKRAFIVQISQEAANQLPDPTSKPVTPPAGAGGAPASSADH